MVDQNSQFYAILTNVGAAKQANADALGLAWKITQMAVGDANGTDPTPSATQTSLINEWRRAPLNQLKVDDNDPSIIVAEQVIPADIGGKWIREIGLYDEDGDLVALANCAPTYKPLLSQGSGRTQVVRMSLVVSSAANVQLKIDPSVVLATREWVTEELARQDFKHSVLVATTANITLSGLQTIDGVVLTAGARVLVKNQAAAKDNGLYTAVSGAAWTRCVDANSSAKVTPGLLVMVEKGTTNSDSAWQLVTDAPISLGVTALTFEMAFGRTGVGAGTYRSVQVDKNGRVVAASNPTTVAGYGITDVYTKAETFNKTETTSAIAAAVASAVAGLVDSSPGALDTLKELAAAIGNDPNYAATMITELGKKAPLASPVFTGDPKAPTPAAGDNDTSVATTAFVQAALALFGIGSSMPASQAVTDIASITKGGLYMYAANTPGAPTTTGGSLLHMPRDSRPTQIAADYTARKIFVRHATNTNTYGDWGTFGMLESPDFTGNPTAPTPAVGDNDTSIATTAFVQAALAVFGVGSQSSPLLTDLNSATTGGFWRAAGGAANSVGTGVVVGVTVPYSSTGCLQILSQLTALGSPLHWRAQTAGIWSDWSPFAGLVSPIFSGDPKAPTPSTGDNDTSVATTAFVHNTLASFGLGNGTAAGVGNGTTPEQMAALPAGNYYYQAAITPYPDYAFVMRCKYQTTRGFELANIPYVDRFFGRACNADGTWRVPVELAKLDSPVFTGDPKAPTPAVGDNDTSVATTAFVQAALTRYGMGEMPNAPYVATVDDFALGNGWYSVGNTTVGVKPGNATYGVLMVSSRTRTAASSRVMQIYFDTDTGTDDVWYRRGYGGEWRAWKKFATADDVAAAVKASRRYYSGNVSGVGANTTLTAAQTGFVFNATAAVTITLPAAADAGSGGTFSFRNVSNGNVTIALASGLIYEKNASASSAVLKPGEWAEIQASTTSYFVNARGKLGEAATIDDLNAATPPGMVGHFALSVPPTGWLKRNGAAVSRTAYAALFAAIGTKFGAGDGSTTFNVPDDRELVDRAWTDGLNALDPDRELFSSQAGQNESHTHTGTANTAGSHSHTMTFPRDLVDGSLSNDAVYGDQTEEGTQTLTTSTSGAHSHTLSIAATGGNETRMANRAYLACIKY